VHTKTWSFWWGAKISATCFHLSPTDPPERGWLLEGAGRRGQDSDTIEFDPLEEGSGVDEIEHSAGGLHHGSDMVIEDLQSLLVLALFHVMERHMPP